MKLFIYLAILFLACPLLTEMGSSSDSPIYLDTDDYEGVILPAAQFEDFHLWAGIEEPDGFWMPSADDIAELEVNLTEFIEENEDEFRRDIVEDLPDYIRQYLGYVAEGQRWIYVNALCNHGDGLDWETDIVFVADGGDCFFQVIYNADTGEFSDLSINGEA